MRRAYSVLPSSPAIPATVPGNSGTLADRGISTSVRTQRNLLSVQGDCLAGAYTGLNAGLLPVAGAGGGDRRSFLGQRCSGPLFLPSPITKEVIQ
jgi:hypothetical protein